MIPLNPSTHSQAETNGSCTLFKQLGFCVCSLNPKKQESSTSVVFAQQNQLVSHRGDACVSLLVVSSAMGLDSSLNLILRQDAELRKAIDLNYHVLNCS